MSYRRCISFTDDEKDLVNHFDNNGKSDFVKEAIKFFLRFRDKLYIVPDGLSVSKTVKNEVKNKMIKLIQK
jgi:hypothetical protein